MFSSNKRVCTCMSARQISVVTVKGSSVCPQTTNKELSHTNEAGLNTACGAPSYAAQDQGALWVFSYLWYEVSYVAECPLRALAVCFPEVAMWYRILRALSDQDDNLDYDPGLESGNVDGSNECV